MKRPRCSHSIIYADDNYMNLRVSFCHHVVILMGVNSIICWECF